MDNLEIKYIDGHESFGMSGPWLSKCFINNKRLKKEYLLDNFVFTSDKKLYALTRYSDKADEREFKIIIVDNQNQKYYISKRGSDALLLKSFDLKKITFYLAFHDEIKELKRIIYFSSDNFEEITESDLFE